MAEETLFTQEEVDRIVSQRLARARAGLPTEEEINGYREWKSKKHYTEEEYNTVVSERDAAVTARDAASSELAQTKQNAYLTSKGIDSEDVDYYGFKIRAMVTDGKTFEQAADEYITAHPTRKTVVDFGGDLGNGGNGKSTANAAMNALLRRAR